MRRELGLTLGESRDKPHQDRASLRVDRIPVPLHHFLFFVPINSARSLTWTSGCSARRYRIRESAEEVVSVAANVNELRNPQGGFNEIPRDRNKKKHTQPDHELHHPTIDPPQMHLHSLPLHSPHRISQGFSISITA